MKEMITLKDGQLLQSGIKPSLPAVQSKLWRDSTNVLFVDQSVEKAKGIGNLGTAFEPITGMAQANVSGEQRVYLGTGVAMYRYSNAVTTQLAGAFTSSAWSMIPWGTWLLAVNGVDPPQICKDTNAMVAWANVPANALTSHIVRKLANRPILFHGQEVTWPRTTDVEYFTTPDPTGRAGDFFIRDLDSDVIAVEPMGDNLAYYTRNKMGLITFIGGQSVYGFKNRLEGIGATGLNAVIPVGARHFGMSANGFWVTDGSGFDYIDAPDINRYFDQHFVGIVGGPSISGVHLKDRNVVAWFFPDVDTVTHGFGYNYKTGAWSHIHFQVSAALSQEVFDNPLAATGTEWGLLDKTDDINGDVMSSYLASGPFDAGLPNHYKHWDMVQMNMEGTGAVEIRFGLHRKETFGQDVDDEWLAWTPLLRENWIGEGGRDSVYLSMELRSTAAGVNWRLGGLSVFGEQAGAAQ